jgi:O-antigen/teichoic acid export membrane protein
MSQPTDATRTATHHLTPDLITAYALSLARALSWLVVLGLVARRCSYEVFGVVSLVRGTLSLFGYLPQSLATVLIQKLKPFDTTAVAIAAPAQFDSTDRVIKYESDVPVARRLINSVDVFALLLVLVAYFVAVFYVGGFQQLHGLPLSSNPETFKFLARFLIGGVLLRLLSEPAGAMLVVGGRLWIDNLLQLAGELAFVVGVALLLTSGNIEVVGLAFFTGQAILLVGRLFCAHVVTRQDVFKTVPFAALAIGTGLVFVSFLADFLYAPANQILINRIRMNARELADYALVLQVDAAILLLVSALSIVLLPRVSRAAASRDYTAIRRTYVVGSIVSLALLLIGAIAAWLVAPTVFRWWLGDDMPAARAILPFVLIHTVIGGTAGIGRAVLLGLGKFAAYTVSAVLGGLFSITLAYVLLRYTSVGLIGVPIATSIAVFLRCAIWMPAYILKVLRTPDADRSFQTGA